MLFYALHFHNTNCLEFSFITFFSLTAFSHFKPVPPLLECIFPPPHPLTHTACPRLWGRVTGAETDMWNRLNRSWDQCLTEYSGVKSSTGKNFLKVEGEINSVLKRIKRWELHLHPTISQDFVILCTAWQENSKIRWFYVVSLAWNIIPFSSSPI